MTISTLQSRYRLLLRLLPRWYRTRREEEMVATFMEPDRDEFELNFGWPDRSEIVSVLGLAVRLRLGGARASARPFAWGQAIRLVALLGLLANASLALVALASVWAIGLAGQQPPLPPGSPPSPNAAGQLWIVTLLLARSATVPAFVALVLGRWRAAKLLAGCAVVATIAQLGVGAWSSRDAWWALLGLLGGLPLWVPALTLAGAFHHEAPPVGHRIRWLAALPASAAASVGLMLVLFWTGAYSLSLPCLALLVGAAAYLVLSRFGGVDDSPAWPLALAVLAAVAVISLLANVPGYGGLGSPVLLGGEALALIGGGLLLAATAARRMARLPSPVTS